MKTYRPDACPGCRLILDSPWAINEHNTRCAETGERSYRGTPQVHPQQENGT